MLGQISWPYQERRNFWPYLCSPMISFIYKYMNLRWLCGISCVNYPLFMYAIDFMSPVCWLDKSHIVFGLIEGFPSARYNFFTFHLLLNLKMLLLGTRGSHEQHFRGHFGPQWVREGKKCAFCWWEYFYQQNHTVGPSRMPWLFCLFTVLG